MGNRGNGYQQRPGRLLSKGLALAVHNGFTLRGPGCKERASREGPPASRNPAISPPARNCWSVTDIQRNTPQRRSWPGQYRQSMGGQGLWQQPTSQARTTKQHHPPQTRQVQSQTRHHHIAQLGVRRARTSADFTTTIAATTGRTTSHHQAHRGAGCCGADSHGPSAGSILPKVPGTSRDGFAFHTPSNGHVDRASALRSLASNPHLQVETFKGATRVSRAADRRRPRSLPAKFSESPLSDLSALPPEPAPEAQRVLYVSKHGFHPRSKSPTYPVLIGTKDTLTLALCKKLWRIRRDLEGRKARDNSVVFSEISQSLVADEKETDQWYERMFDEHEKEEEEETEEEGERGEEEDPETAAIEQLRLANEDGAFVQSDESISTVHPRPLVDLVFDRNYLKEHINDWDILGMDIEEEEMKVKKRLRTASVARPTSANRNSGVSHQSSGHHHHQQPDQQAGGGTGKAALPHRRPAAPRREPPHPNAARPGGERRGTRLPAVPTGGRVFHARETRKKTRGRKGAAKRPTTLASRSDDEDVAPEPALNGRERSRSPSSPSATTPEGAANGDLELDDMDRRKDLISKYLLPPRSGGQSTSPVDEPEEQPDEEVDSEDRDEEKEDGEVEEKPKELTEKEKFVLMRKRMDDRKAKMQKRREDFLDYSMLGIRSQRRRGNAGEAGGGEPSTAKNSLGSLISTRLESMATFKTRQYQGEEMDEDDEDEDDDVTSSEEEDS